MEQIISKHDSYCMALGFFDCMHLGHRAIFRTANEYAKVHGLKFAVFTFSQPIKREGDDKPKQVYSFCERKILYAECGAAEVVAYPFTNEVKNTDKYDFLNSLTKNYDICAFVCGEDYSFGKNGAGNVEFLKKYCCESNIELVVVPVVKQDTGKISTTLIKSLLSNGNIVDANELLCEKYFIYGEVIKGRGEGHTFGIPTANISVESNKFLPKCGVYACIAEIDGKKYDAVTNVGTKPTFDDYSTTVEALIENFDGNLYGKFIRLSFVKYLRDIKKFDTVKELVETIKNDIKRSKKLC